MKVQLWILIGMAVMAARCINLTWAREQLEEDRRHYAPHVFSVASCLVGVIAAVVIWPMALPALILSMVKKK